MKTIKFLMAIALVSVIAISCKETEKKEAPEPIKTEVNSEIIVVEEEEPDLIEKDSTEAEDERTTTQKTGDAIATGAKATGDAVSTGAKATGKAVSTGAKVIAKETDTLVKKVFKKN